MELDLHSNQLSGYSQQKTKEKKEEYKFYRYFNNDNKYKRVLPTSYDFSNITSIKIIKKGCNIGFKKDGSAIIWGKYGIIRNEYIKENIILLAKI